MIDDRFVVFLISQGLGTKTWKIYRNLARRADDWISTKNGRSLAEATAVDVAEWVETLPRTQSSRAQVVAAFRWYWQSIGRDDPPTKAIRVPPGKAMVCKALSAEDTTTLRTAAMDWWMPGAVVLMGLYLALRREEIATAEWERFNENGTVYTVTGKFDKTAELPVHPTLWYQLKPYRAASGWVFTGRCEHHHVDPTTIAHWVGLVGKKAGVSLTTHQLRHTSLAHARDGGAELRDVMRFARHSSPVTTAGYTRTNWSALEGVANNLDF